MRVGTKSVLFGAHCFFLHPWFVAVAWWKLFGFPWDPRLWVAFFVHDLGYLGKPNMDGAEGEEHPRLGAAILHALFDRHLLVEYACWDDRRRAYVSRLERERSLRWHDFSLYHSRFLAKRDGRRPSRLCVADKLAIALTPAWLYLPMARATGEILEYRAQAEQREGAKYRSMNLDRGSDLAWYRSVQTYLLRWVEAHRDGREDTWTPPTPKRQAVDRHGTWR